MAFSVIRTCPSCHARNRVAAKDVTKTARCGACQAVLPPVAEPIDVDAEGFDQIVAHAARPVLVDFWADWCGPCRMAAPDVKALAHEMAGRAVVLKVDTEAHPDISARFGVRSIPNFVVLSHGKVVHQQAGVAPRDQMRRWIEQAG